MIFLQIGTFEMPAIIIEINTTAGQQKVARLLKVIEPRTLLSEIGERFRSYVDTQFRTLGEGRWPRLAWTTLALRQRADDKPFHGMDSKYRQSIVTETDGQTFVEVGSNWRTATGVPLAKIHEFGTAPYVIRPKRAQILAAKTGLAGPVGLIATKHVSNWFVFANVLSKDPRKREVHHPGIPARPVLPTKAVAERIIQTSVDGMLARAVERGM